MEIDPLDRSQTRRVALLGSTGSIGLSALDVLDRLAPRFCPVALAANSSSALLAEQTLRYRPEVIGLADASAEAELRARLSGKWSGEIRVGPDAATSIAAEPDVDVVLNGLVGAAGLRPSWVTLKRGASLALANKESLVIAGEILTRLARETGAPILPIDSEHNGLFQLLEGRPIEGVTRVVLTASGGPFRTRDLSTFDEISADEALQHPTWSMGSRITIDSATLLNKGFEVLEARWLFDLRPEQVGVWIHPQSIVHGFVEWHDGSTTAQLSVPDMRIPIQNALCHPERIETELPRCNLAEQQPLEFFEPDRDRYPCLALAERAMTEAGSAPAVLNAADEVLVQSFLDGQIRFPQIGECLERVLDQRPQVRAEDLDTLLEADAWARDAARSVLSRCG